MTGMPYITYAKIAPTKQQIELAETILQTTFGQKLKEYLERYGYIETDTIEFYGMTRQTGIQSNLIVKTNQLRQNNPSLPHNLIAIESPSEQQYTRIDADDMVWLYQTNHPPEPLHLTLNQYIQSRISPL